MDSVAAYGVGSTTQFPGLYIDTKRVVAQSADTIVTEIEPHSGIRTTELDPQNCGLTATPRAMGT